MTHLSPLLKTIFAAMLSGCVALIALPAQATPAVAPSRIIANQYIVVLKPEALPAGLSTLDLTNLVRSVLAQVGGGTVLAQYQVALLGFAARLSPNQAAALAKLPYVASVESDQIMMASATQAGANWGLDRIDQHSMPLNSLYIYRDNAGAGVNLYIIDTGLNSGHIEFTGRVGAGRNFAPNKDGLFASPVDAKDTTDCNGHGTHVAGTSSGTTYGVAKKTTLHSVRVLGCDGSGTNAGVISGIDWVAANAVKPAVANMSLGGGDSSALDAAVKSVIAKGVVMAVAAGNDSADACTGSPNKVPEAITVGATQNNDAQASYSNFGPCVDLYAPGTNIISSWIGSSSASKVISGTSMASPHVAGAAALILGVHPSYTPQQVVDSLLTDATLDVLTKLGVNSPNVLLYTAH